MCWHRTAAKYILARKYVYKYDSNSQPHREKDIHIHSQSGIPSNFNVIFLAKTLSLGSFRNHHFSRQEEEEGEEEYVSEMASIEFIQSNAEFIPSQQDIFWRRSSKEIHRKKV